jgi:hypothetical protein
MNEIYGSRIGEKLSFITLKRFPACLAHSGDCLLRPKHVKVSINLNKIVSSLVVMFVHLMSNRVADQNAST